MSMSPRSLYAHNFTYMPQVKDILLTKEGSEQDEFSQCVFYGEV